MIGKTLKRANPAPALRYLLSIEKFFEEDAHIAEWLERVPHQPTDAEGGGC